MSSNVIYQQISELYLNGSTIDALQRQFHRSFIFVKQALQSTNTPLRTLQGQLNYRVDEIKLLAKTKSKAQIIELLGGSIHSLDQFLKNNNLVWKELIPSISETFTDQIIKCRTELKMSCIEIVEHLQLDCCTSTIGNILRQNNIPPLTNDEELEARYRRNLKRYGTTLPSALPESIEKSNQTRERNRKHKQLQIDLGEWIEPDTQYFVYILKDPKDNTPFYIGKGSGDRPVFHFRAAKNNWKDSNRLKINKIRQIMKLGSLPDVEIIKCDSEQKAFELEVSLIKQLGRRNLDEGGILTNMTLGGEGYTFGHRPVDQYNLFGEYIQTFPSLLEAAQYCGKTNSSSIIASCKRTGTTKAAFGYFWTYHDELLDLDRCWDKKKPIVKKDLQGNIVERFINKAQAGFSVGSTAGGISIAVRTGKLHREFYWDYITK